jgi:hypothetical protein
MKSSFDELKLDAVTRRFAGAASSSRCSARPVAASRRR